MRIQELYDSSGLLPYSQLPDITDPGWDPAPLSIECMGSEGQYMVSLGLAHRSDRGNLHYRALQAYAMPFAFSTESRERIIINEGGVWPVAASLDLAYAEGGESMWLQTFGAQAGIKVVTTELPHDGADLMLAEGLSQEEIACYYFVRQAPQWKRLAIRPDFQTYIQLKMNRQKEKLGWNFDFSVKNLVNIYEEIYCRPFDPSETNFFLQQSGGYMRPLESRVQYAAMICNMGRDVNLIQTQLEYFNAGVSLLTGFGWSHIRVQKPAIEQIGYVMVKEVTAHDLGSLMLDNYVLH